MRTLTDILEPYIGRVTAIIGSGGKTALMWALAAHFRAEKTLVTTTTKIFPPEKTAYDYFGLGTAAENGVTLYGIPDAKSGKLTSPPMANIAAAAKRYDHVLMECDGSRNLPLKGWAPHEPAVPAFADATIGVLPITALGCVAGADTVYRLPDFFALTGARAGERVSEMHMRRVITGGLFEKAVGRRLLFLSQADDTLGIRQARRLVEGLPRTFLNTVALVTAGSALQDEGEIIWERKTAS